jgi:alkylation response protein AidB-like acyl-CoA dehydrogenase
VTDARAATLEAVQALAPEFRVRAAEGEALRTMPADLAVRVKRAGLFRLALPRALGGWELDPATLVEIIEQLSCADGSAGWSVFIGNSTAFFAWLEPGVARDMIGGDVGFASTSMFGPYGQAVANGADDVAVSGRWPFNSGCPHAEWLQVGVSVPGEANWQFAFVPRHLATIEDTWHAMGLRGTGSHHLSMAEVHVPREHLAAPLFEPARHDGPLWRLPGFSLATIFGLGFPLGVARRALDEFSALAGRKSRGDGTRTLSQDGHVQAQVAAAEAGLRAARAFALDTIGEIWMTACAGDPPSVEQRGRLLLVSSQAMRAAVQAVDTSFYLAGAGAVYDDQPLQRCFRDIHTANQHLIFSTLRDQAWASVHFGLAEPTFFI